MELSRFPRAPNHLHYTFPVGPATPMPAAVALTQFAASALAATGEANRIPLSGRAANRMRDSSLPH